MSNNLAPELPIWLTEKNATALASVAQSYWQEIESYLFWWLAQQHSENAQTAILDLLAWERSINRLPGESLELYGMRVKHAFANATDAGSNVGMEQIFKRLGWGFIQVNERVPGFDWDMVEIAMLEDQFSGKEPLISEIIKQYGRTCRRYYLTALTAVTTTHASGLIEFDKEVIG
ncbi:phage tail protein [Pseudoalteromonas sp. SG45-5]|uniref:phage tail protein n=1 Tax=unclassified Pseudoalteromonas TaxID=194690 RepID=UPI0015F7D8FE|nr:MULTISPECIES: phage tail protein [unclassified Pseudoalteromonas]MBB1384361.1 phage tail protein [Pseudoalteromonas sp. SG45-5]MBB1392351.1 phage tail protein [Pseudoalteromonas sp. SG44-4]MBB1446826.1 phage tail protein [Pseudoalteromonas sp. SG41-6]